MGHYYQKLDDGAIRPMHFTQMKSRDELRPTRITDVKKWWREGMLVAPSVTTVLNTLSKPALQNWLIDQHLQTAAEYAHWHVDDPDGWIDTIKRKTDERMAIAPDAGTDMHKVLEAFFNGQDPKDELLHRICYAVGDKVDEICGDRRWTTESYFVHPKGFGGCADLKDDGWVIDFKTKNQAAKFKPGKMAYDDHRMQLAAYREGFGMPDARCANIFICLETGQIDFHKHTSQELAHGWEMFKHALAIWQLRNGWPEVFRA